jgi:death-on-curing protein
LHRRVAAQSGGAAGVRDLAALESALAQPRATFGGAELYPTLAAKAAALGFSLVANHPFVPFVDGNKRVGHAALETLLVLHGYELAAPVEDAERVMLAVASGALTRDEFTQWVAGAVVPLGREGAGEG